MRVTINASRQITNLGCFNLQKLTMICGNVNQSESRLLYLITI